jgi:hypothetical protein
MGDPGLVAVDLVDVALPHRPRLERRKIGAGIGLGEHGGRQHFARGEFGQPLALLFLGAGADDQLSGDFGARAERADPDIAAREFLGHHAHRFLAEAEAAILFRDGEAEHAELGHLRQDIERDIAVGAVPLVRLRHHLAVGELAHLIANRRQRLVETAVADGGTMMRSHQLDQARAALNIPGRVQVPKRPGQPRGDGVGREPDVGGTHDFALTHGNAALDLGEILADPELDEQLLGLSKTAAGVHPLRIRRELPYRLDISREPGEAMGRALLAVEQSIDHAAVDRDPLPYRRRRLRQQCVRRLRRLPRERNEPRRGTAALSLVQHRRSPRGGAPPGPIRASGRTRLSEPSLRDYACIAQMQRRNGNFSRIAGSLRRSCCIIDQAGSAANAARPRSPAGACSWQRGSCASWPGCCGCGRRTAVCRR